MPKGHSPMLKGTLCNIPTNVVNDCNALPYPVDINDIIRVKLKRKLQYHGCKTKFYFEIFAGFKIK